MDVVQEQVAVEWLKISAPVVSAGVAALVAVLVFWLKQSADRRKEERAEIRKVFAEFLVATRQLEQALTDGERATVLRAFWQMNLHEMQLRLVGQDELTKLSNEMLSGLLSIFELSDISTETANSERADHYKRVQAIQEMIVADMRSVLSK